jgi:hypothetical protein
VVGAGVVPCSITPTDYLWCGTLGLAGFLGQATAGCFIADFLMASGDTSRRKLVRIAGPTFSQKKGTLSIALLAAAASLLIHFIVGQLIAPLVTGRAARMNPVVIFVGVLALGLSRASINGRSKAHAPQRPASSRLC